MRSTTTTIAWLRRPLPAATTQPPVLLKTAMSPTSSIRQRRLPLTIDHDGTGAAAASVTIRLQGVAHTANIEDTLLSDGNLVVL
jgi:hypothetical protein